MKTFAALSLLFAAVAVNAEYVFHVTRFGEGLELDFTCTFDASTEAGTAIEVRKYTNFMSGNSTYTENVFNCRYGDNSAACVGSSADNSCDPAYEGEFCGNYGGVVEVVSCKK